MHKAGSSVTFCRRQLTIIISTSSIDLEAALLGLTACFRGLRPNRDNAIPAPTTTHRPSRTILGSIYLAHVMVQDQKYIGRGPFPHIGCTVEVVDSR